jgi:hypothetical protein
MYNIVFLLFMTQKQRAASHSGFRNETNRAVILVRCVNYTVVYDVKFCIISFSLHQENFAFYSRCKAHIVRY